MAGWVVSGVGLLDDAPDDLVDAVVELAGEQDRDQCWRVRADKLAALGVAHPAVVADIAVVEVVDDPLPEHRSEDIRIGRSGRERRSSGGGGACPGRANENGGRARAGSPSFLGEGQ